MEKLAISRKRWETRPADYGPRGEVEASGCLGGDRCPYQQWQIQKFGI